MSGDPARPWLVLTGLAFGICVTNGFARFAYGLILPAMQAELDWSYAQAGWLNTVNALGYIGGAVLTMALIRRVSPARLFNFGLVTTAVSLFATGMQEAMWWQMLWRFLAGFLGAMSFSTAGALAAGLFRDDPRRNALAIAILFGVGGGLGVMLAGAALPPMLAIRGDAAWPFAWTLIGLAAFAMVPLSFWSANAAQPVRQAETAHVPLPLRAMLGEMAGYGAFGLGYIVYFTFLGAWMKAQGTGAVLSAAVWVMLGICLCASPFLWRPVFARFRSGVPLAMILTGIALGSVLPIVVAGPAGLVISALIFGSCVFMSPGAVTSFVRQNLDAPAWGRAISLYTVIFAVAQTVGPYGAGWIGDAFGALDASLIAAACILLAGAGCALMQRPIAGDR